VTATTKTHCSGLAVSPVFHQQHRAHRRRGHHPPRPRDHRDRVLRPHRRPAGPPALRALRRELGMGDLHRDGTQPAPRRGNIDRSSPRARPRRDPATAPDQRARPTRQTPRPTRATAARSLATRPTMAHLVEQHFPHQTPTTSDRMTEPTRPNRTGEAGQTSRSTMLPAGQLITKARRPTQRSILKPLHGSKLSTGGNVKRLRRLRSGRHPPLAVCRWICGKQRTHLPS
jgi:hypothetical protein